MATAIKARKITSRNSFASAAQQIVSAPTIQAAQVAPAADVDMLAIRAAAMAFVSKIAAENYDRDDLTAGDSFACRASLVIDVAGQKVAINANGSVNVEPDITRASSTGCKIGEVVAYLLSKVNAATRAATLANMAEDFAANGCRLPVSEEAVEEADKAMARLRQKKDQHVRGSVRVNLA